MRVISLSLALRAPALTGTARIREAIEKAEGVITQSRELASWAIVYMVELAGPRLGDLGRTLTEAGVVWLDDSDTRLQELAARLAGAGSDDVTVLMHVDLVNDEPERPVKVPAVPG
jgi:hypothetical protein